MEAELTRSQLSGQLRDSCVEDSADIHPWRQNYSSAGKIGLKSRVKTRSEKEWGLKYPLCGSQLFSDGSSAQACYRAVRQKRVSALEQGCAPTLLAGQPSQLDNHFHTQGEGEKWVLKCFQHFGVKYSWFYTWGEPRFPGEKSCEWCHLPQSQAFHNLL